MLDLRTNSCLPYLSKVWINDSLHLFETCIFWIQKVRTISINRSHMPQKTSKRCMDSRNRILGTDCTSSFTSIGANEYNKVSAFHGALSRISAGQGFSGKVWFQCSRQKKFLYAQLLFLHGFGGERSRHSMSLMQVSLKSKRSLELTDFGIIGFSAFRTRLRGGGLELKYIVFTICWIALRWQRWHCKWW